MSSGIQAHAPHGSSQPTHGSAKALDDCPSWRASTIATIATIRVSPFISVSFKLDRQSSRRDTLRRRALRVVVSADIRRQALWPGDGCRGAKGERDREGCPRRPHRRN